MPRELGIETAAVFLPLIEPARYKGAYGGRGSGKSHFFAGLMVEDALDSKGVRGEGLRGMCVREVQKDLEQSARHLLVGKLEKARLGIPDGFKVYSDVIQTPGDGIIIFKGMQEYTAQSIKSLEGFHRAWCEEAHAMSSTSLTLLRPTLRAGGSEIWASWNPTRKADAIDILLRKNAPPGALVVKANYRDNPWFPPELELERAFDQDKYPDRYGHIWDGEYATVTEGAYYAKALSLARQQGRIAYVPQDPLIRVRLFADIGGAGARADAMSFWAMQWVGHQIRVLDYLEYQGQALDHIVGDLRKRGYQEALIQMPHDGVNTNAITGKRYVDHYRDAGFECLEPWKNPGVGAEMMRVEAARRLFNQMWFHDDPDKKTITEEHPRRDTENGRIALGWYHEKRDDKRLMGLGPNHDWSSHAADAFGLAALCYEEPYVEQPREVEMGTGGDEWMG